MRYLLLSVLFCAALQTFCQEQAVVGNAFITRIDNIVVYGVDAQGNKNASLKFKVMRGTKFNVNGFDEQSNVKITFWPYQKSASKGYAKTARSGFTRIYESREFIGEWSDNHDFVMELETFNEGCQLFYGERHDFTWGIMTLPMKIRHGNRDKERDTEVEENLNLGFTFGYRYQMPGRVEQALNGLAGVSITRVRVTERSLSNGFPLPESSVAAALMLSAGILYQHENFQVGPFVGTDIIPSELGKNWKHQSKLWFGVAIGVSLFSRNASSGQSGNNK